jgi:hypothetical protein
LPNPTIRGWLAEHDPEKWAPVFRKDHAQTKKKTMLKQRDEIIIRLNQSDLD